MHAGHEQLLRWRFFVPRLVSIPVLYCSDLLERILGVGAPRFPAVDRIDPAFAVVVFLDGWVPLLPMAVPELPVRAPGIPTLISVAITLDFVYSPVTAIVDCSESLVRERVTPLLLLLGCFIEMRFVRQATSAFDELGKRLSQTTERITRRGLRRRLPSAASQKASGFVPGACEAGL